VNFDLKTDPNTDLILTQSREQLAAGQLPPDVSSYGVTIRKSVTAPLMLVGLFSRRALSIRSSLATTRYQLNDPIARLYGVGQTQVFGAGQYAMRLWVQPDKLAKLGITVTDIVNAVQARTRSILLVRWAVNSSREPAIHLFRACARPTDVPGTIRNVIVREAPNGGIFVLETSPASSWAHRTTALSAD